MKEDKVRGACRKHVTDDTSTGVEKIRMAL